MTNFPYRVDLWMDDECSAIEEHLADLSTLKLGQLVYNAAVRAKPDRMITLRNGTRIVAQSREPPRSPDDKIVPIRRLGPIFSDTDDDEGR